MSKFFIHRPIFAWVIAIFVVLAGIVSITRLPVAQFPSVAPPTITVTAAYPGATAQTLTDSGKPSALPTSRNAPLAR